MQALLDFGISLDILEYLCGCTRGKHHCLLWSLVSIGVWLPIIGKDFGSSHFALLVDHPMLYLQSVCALSHARFQIVFASSYRFLLNVSVHVLICLSHVLTSLYITFPWLFVHCCMLLASIVSSRIVCTLSDVVLSKVVFDQCPSSKLFTLTLLYPKNLI